MVKSQKKRINILVDITNQGEYQEQKKLHKSLNWVMFQRSNVVNTLYYTITVYTIRSFATHQIRGALVRE